MAMIVKRIEEGKGREGDVELLGDVAKNIMGRTVCPLSEAAGMPVQSFLKKFRHEFDQHIRDRKCPSGNQF
jgi:NADH-quinone oxidoreductase subunit F